MPDMHFYNSSAWRKAINIHVWAASAWQPVKSVWVWSGGIWQIAFTTASISNLNGIDTNGNPALGELDIIWTDVPDTSAWTVRLDADLSGGSTYSYNIATGITPSTALHHVSLDGVAGFSTLDNTNIRAQLLDGSTIIKTLTMSGPYPT